MSMISLDHCFPEGCSEDARNDGEHESIMKALVIPDHCSRAKLARNVRVKGVGDGNICRVMFEWLQELECGNIILKNADQRAGCAMTVQGCCEVPKFVIKLLRHDESVPREDDEAVRFDDLAEHFEAHIDGTSEWTVDAWITFLAKGGGPVKRFEYCLNPNSSTHFLYFRAIQGHSGGNLVDPALQDNVLLPDDFAEYIYHIGNANELHSIIKSGLIPGGRSPKKDRRSVFFTAVNPMDDHQDLEEVQCDLYTPRIAVYKNTWRAHQNTVHWCKLKLAQRKELQFCQTRSHAIALFNTLPAV